MGDILKSSLHETSRLKLFVNVLVFLAALYGASQHSYKIDKVSFFESVMIEAFAPFQRGTMSVKEKVSYFFSHYIMIVNTSKKNEELEKQIEQLDNKLFTLQEVRKENERLKQLLEFGEDIPRRKVLAQVVGWDASNEFKILRINKGSNHGLKLQDPVITMNGLVGYVYRMTPNYSDILTILDQNNRVPAVVSSTRSKGVVEGTSEFRCRLKYIVRTDEVSVGDDVLTEQIGERYPENIRIGTITSIDKEKFGITQEIEIKPSVDFSRLEEVLVLLAPKTREAAGKVTTDNEVKL